MIFVIIIRSKRAILVIQGMSVIMLKDEINRNTGTHARINSEEMINDFALHCMKIFCHLEISDKKAIDS